MGISNGSSLGPYKVLSLLSRGGEGSDVYRARDTRSGREVAVQVVSRTHPSDPSWLQRFEEEARAASALSHPNIASVHDAGLHDGSPYVVTELVGGESLREKLGRGALPVPRAVKYASQVLQGLAAAHGKGAVHGGLRPESLFIAHDDRVKILGFGLSELDRPDPSGCYLAPEQARGQAADARSDVFAVGAILYEMLTGRRAFGGTSPAEARNAILTEEPAPLTAAVQRIPPGVAAVVRGCLEKEPGRRFQSAEDVGAALEVAVTASGLGEVTPRQDPRRRRRRAIVALASIVLLLGTHLGIHAWGAKSVKTPIPSFTRLTFRRGEVNRACFTPDGQTVVYGAWHEGLVGSHIFSQRLGTTNARMFDFEGFGSPIGTFGGEMALIRGDGSGSGGRLARMPLEGGAPRDIIGDVVQADCSSDGKTFVVERVVDGQFQIECPIGKVLVRGTGSQVFLAACLSPKGDKIGYIQKASAGSFAGSVVVVDLAGNKRVLTHEWRDIQGGLAWSPDGRELWFDATDSGTTHALYAVTLAGKERLVARLPWGLIICNIAPDGRVLLVQGESRKILRGRIAGDRVERDLSWLDGTCEPILSPDGTKMVFQEWGDAGGADASAYFRRMDGSPPVRLGDGSPCDVSPDWKTVLCMAGELRLVPIGAGETRVLPRGTIQTYIWAWWHPDGKRIVINGTEAGRPMRLFIQELPDGLPRPFTPEGVVGAPYCVTPDGRYCVARPRGRSAPWALYPIEGGEPRPLPGLDRDYDPIVWSEDGRFLFVSAPAADEWSARVLRLEVRTGRAEPWLELTRPNEGIGIIRVTPNGRYYTHWAGRGEGSLYLAEGLR